MRLGAPIVTASSSLADVHRYPPDLSRKEFAVETGFQSVFGARSLRVKWKKLAWRGNAPGG